MMEVWTGWKFIILPGLSKDPFGPTQPKLKFHLQNWDSCPKPDFFHFGPNEAQYEIIYNFLRLSYF